MRYLAKIVRFLEKISGWRVDIREEWIILRRTEEYTLKATINELSIMLWYETEDDDKMIHLSHEDLKKIWNKAKKLH